jgi:hypothetical protein
MADELKLSGSLAYSDSEGTELPSFDVIELLVDVSTKRYVHAKVSVGTSEEAIDLGDLSAPLGWAMFVNRDSTNYVELRLGTGASNDMVRVNAGEFALFRFGSDVSAPYLIAPTAACQVEYRIHAP